MNTITSTETTKNPMSENILGILCFGIFAAGVFYSNTRAIPEPPRPSLVQVTNHQIEPNLALLRHGDLSDPQQFKQFKVVIR